MVCPLEATRPRWLTSLAMPSTSVIEVPCKLYTLHAANGDPLLIYGEDEAGEVFLWPTRYIENHRVAFARWSLANVHRWKGKRFMLCHPVRSNVRRWAEWLGVTFEHGMVVI